MQYMQRRDVDRIQDELNELFADLWQVPGFVGRRHGFRPHVDCFRSESPDAVTVVVELAGIDPETVDLSVKNPNGGEAVTHRSPAAILDETAALDAESADVLQTIRGLL